MADFFSLARQLATLADPNNPYPMVSRRFTLTPDPLTAAGCHLALHQLTGEWHLHPAGPSATPLQLAHPPKAWLAGLVVALQDMKARFPEFAVQRVSGLDLSHIPLEQRIARLIDRAMGVAEPLPELPTARSSAPPDTILQVRYTAEEKKKMQADRQPPRRGTIRKGGGDTRVASKCKYSGDVDNRVFTPRGRVSSVDWERRGAGRHVRGVSPMWRKDAR